MFECVCVFAYPCAFVWLCVILCDCVLVDAKVCLGVDVFDFGSYVSGLWDCGFVCLCICGFVCLRVDGLVCFCAWCFCGNRYVFI